MTSRWLTYTDTQVGTNVQLSADPDLALYSTKVELADLESSFDTKLELYTPSSELIDAISVGIGR